VVKAGKRLWLDRSHQQTASCTEMVLLLDFNKSAKLLPWENQFACEMKMARGK